MANENFESVETFEVPGRQGGQPYVCFRNAHGEVFHFQRSQLKRGMPFGPWRTADCINRPLSSLTIENASHVSGLSPQIIRNAIWSGVLPAVMRKWRWGNVFRRGYLVEMKHVRELVARRALERAKGLIEWDVSALEVVGEGGEKDQPK